jgi:fermentation-respiration switch protein FrsA (DUF1100 family)
VRGLNLLKLAEGYKNKVLVVHGDRDEKVPVAVVGQYRDLYGSAMKLVIVDGANHQFSSVPWRQKAFDASIEFLKTVDT